MKLIIPLMIIVLIIIIFIIPLKIPYNVKVPGKIFAAEEWMILKGRNGELITILRDYRSGISKRYSVTEFERGDNASVSLSSSITPGRIISESDTIASIISNELEVRLSSLRGQLSVTKNILKSSLTGEKESVKQEAKDNLDYARKRAEAARKIFDRQEQLFKKNLISEQAYDSAMYAVELSEISIEIAEARLRIVNTGEKPEQIEMLKSQISALEKEIDILEKRSASYNFTSPLVGYVSEMQLGDTLLVISDTSQYTVFVSIPLREVKYLSSNFNVAITSTIDGNSVMAKLKRIDNTVEYLLSRPVVSGVAVTEKNENSLMPGLIVECSIQCRAISVLEHIKRFFNIEIL